MLEAEFYRMACEDEREKAEQAVRVLRKQQEVQTITFRSHRSEQLLPVYFVHVSFQLFSS